MWSVAVSLFELFTGRIMFPGRHNNDMLRLMMKVKGRFSGKLLGAGLQSDLHFRDGKFIRRKPAVAGGADEEKLKEMPSRPKRRIAQLLAPRPGETRSASDRRSVVLFADFLERALMLHPAKRMKVREALQHPFIKQTT
jgi:serine/threonine-protein kinase PRP4